MWICAANGPEDVEVAAERGPGAFVSPETSGWRLRMLDIDPAQHHQFYAMIANPLLWFLQHDLWGLSDAPDIGPDEHAAWTQGYVEVNRQFADAILEQVRDSGDAAILIQDYHLYLVPQLVRSACPAAFISFFCHIPWPPAGAWSILPREWRVAIFDGILGADIVGFHTEAYARNFVRGCEDVLYAETDDASLTVSHNHREVAARWYPISVAVDDLLASAESDAVLEREVEIERLRREWLIVRVDRTDLSKNILRGFRAFDMLLERHPELWDRVTFLALLQPSRQDVREYVDYLDRIRHTVDAVNAKYGSVTWQPIDLRIIDDLSLALAAYRQFDVLLVNAVADGMNLVAKEGVVVNRRNGVLVLSERAGASAELGRLALTINPFDVDEQAEALWQALTMPEAERRARLSACAEVVRHNDLRRWLRTQLDHRDRR